MAKPPTPDTIALTVRERILLFCAGSGTDWQRAGVTSEIVTALVVKGLVMRDALGRVCCAAGAVAGAVRWHDRGLCPDDRAHSKPESWP